MYYSLGVFFFLLCLPMHACNARRLGFVAEEIDNHADFRAKDVNKLKLLDQLEMRPSISKKEVQTQELQQDRVHGRRIQQNFIGATMKQTLSNSLLKANEVVEKAISSGYEIIISSGVDLHSMAKVERVTRSRSMLGNSGGDTEENLSSDKKDNVDGDIDVQHSSVIINLIQNVIVLLPASSFI